MAMRSRHLRYRPFDDFPNELQDIVFSHLDIELHTFLQDSATRASALNALWSAFCRAYPYSVLDWRTTDDVEFAEYARRCLSKPLLVYNHLIKAPAPAKNVHELTLVLPKKCFGWSRPKGAYIAKYPASWLPNVAVVNGLLSRLPVLRTLRLVGISVPGDNDNNPLDDRCVNDWVYDSQVQTRIRIPASVKTLRIEGIYYAQGFDAHSDPDVKTLANALKFEGKVIRVPIACFHELLHQTSPGHAVRFELLFDRNQAIRDIEDQIENTVLDPLEWNDHLRRHVQVMDDALGEVNTSKEKWDWRRTAGTTIEKRDLCIVDCDWKVDGFGKAWFTDDNYAKYVYRLALMNARRM